MPSEFHFNVMEQISLPNATLICIDYVLLEILYKSVCLTSNQESTSARWCEWIAEAPEIVLASYGGCSVLTKNRRLANTRKAMARPTRVTTEDAQEMRCITY